MPAGISGWKDAKLPTETGAPAPLPAASRETDESRYDQFWALGANAGAWAHGNQIDVGPRDGDKQRTLRAAYTVRWGVVLDASAERLVLDGGCGAPGSTANDAELCLLTSGKTPLAVSLPATTSKRDYPRGALLLGDGRLLVTNGLHVALVHPDGKVWDRDAMTALREQKLVEECRPLFNGNLHCGQFYVPCEAGWKVTKPLARGATGTPELELSYCKGGDGCFFDPVRELALVVAPGADAVEWKRVNPSPPVEPELREAIEHARKKR